MDYSGIISNQRKFFLTHQTKSVDFRIEQLKKLKHLIRQYEPELYKAIHEDFRKSEFETFGSELSFIYYELNESIRKLHHWANPKTKGRNLINILSRSYVVPEPLGVCLVMSAWNYPYMLAFRPLVAAMAAGNTIIVKPSEIPIRTSHIIAKIINENFSEDYITVVEGGIPETTALLEQRFDKIFFTGSTKVGRIVYEAAAKHLTPVILEMGGKSPAIVTDSAGLKEAAKRIAWGKFFNAGQSCIAPDFVLVDQKVKDDLLNEMIAVIRRSEYAFDREYYPQIVNDRNYERLLRLLDKDKLYFGGETDKTRRHISPSILTGISFDHPVMQEEIFGPILPVLTFNDFDEALLLLRELPKPLSCYLFSKNKNQQKQLVQEYSFGNGAINDTMMQISNPHIPFGGVGESGMGSYHGKAGFDSFSHFKSIMHKPLWEPPLKYPPYNKTRQRILKWLLSH